MNSSANFSSRAACALLAALLGACAGRQKAPPRQMRVAVFPPANIGASAAPMKELRAAIEAALREQQFELVEPQTLEPFLEHHRVRYTGGVDLETSIAAATELGVEGVVITSVESYQASPPRVSLTQRLVSAGDKPAIVWIDGASRSGDESPGFFDLGLVPDAGQLTVKMLHALAGSLAAFRDGRGPRAVACPGAGRYGPRNFFRSSKLDPRSVRGVAVLPFLNETRQRGAGESVALELVRQLEASGRFRVVEPGLVRDELLRYRIVMENGVSLDMARVISELVHTDFVLAGYVREYEDGSVPRVDFTVLLIDNANSEVLWQSTSYNRGDDGVFFFDAGAVGTAAALSCRMAGGVVDRIRDR